MNKEQAKKHIEENLNDGDSLIGFFQAISPPNYWLVFLIGPFFILTMKVYFLAVTEKGISFYKLSMMGKFKENDFFEFDDIESVKIGKGLLQRPMKFTFKNNRKIKIKAQLKGVEKVAKLLPDVQQHIESNIPLVQ
ncbi:PH domain-containing protein [Vibrio intestinalis]|uniref:PH domain-containing protein n=1 Tax=Vibrio intestinalis TaxID=2933291 RepID=UPI0021A96C8D|nr:PH domain-containing protein [Vibrio intestinalis]